LKEKEIVEFFDCSLKECRDVLAPVRRIWKDSLAKYSCSKDFSKKKDWQFKVYYPMAKPKTKRFTNLVKSTLLKSDYYFDFDTPKRSQTDPWYKNDLWRCNYTKRLLKAHLDSRPCSFVDHFCESLEAAAGYSGMLILKFWVGYHDNYNYDPVRSEVSKKRAPVLKCKAVDPFMFDWSADGSIQIEHQYVTLPELWDLADDGIFDKKVLNKLMNNDYGDVKRMKDEDKSRLERLKLGDYTNAYRKEVLLSHYWGPLINKDNKIEKKHCHFIVANEKFILTDILDNPYPDKSTPYVFSPLIRFPFRHVGKALTEDVNPLEDAATDFLNLQLDNLLWQVLGIMEVDRLALDSQAKDDLQDLYPGKPILKKIGYQGEAFRYHSIGTDPTKAMPILQEIKMVHDMDHGINEFVSAESSLGSITASEQTQKRTDALGQVEGFATDLERGFFTRCLDKARDLVLQYLCDPASDTNAEKILGEEGKLIDELSEEERKSLIVSEYNIIPRGVSIFFDRMKKLNNYTGFYKVMNALPDEAKAMINWRAFLDDVIDIFALDNMGDKLKTPEEIEAQQQSQAQQQQEMLQLEIQKHLLPLQTKLQQTEMGIRERTEITMSKLQHDMEKAVMEMENKLRLKAMEMEHKDRERKTQQGLKLLELAIPNEPQFTD
jgi:hypothetical protein